MIIVITIISSSSVKPVARTGERGNRETGERGNVQILIRRDGATNTLLQAFVSLLLRPFILIVAIFNYPRRRHALFPYVPPFRPCSPVPLFPRSPFPCSPVPLTNHCTSHYSAPSPSTASAHRKHSHRPRTLRLRRHSRNVIPTLLRRSWDPLVWRANKLSFS